MNEAVYLVKIGELMLKSGNLKDFEQRLVQNARLLIEGTGSRVSLRAGRMYVEGPEQAAASIEFMLNHLVGITGWARATVISKDIDSIKEAVLAEALKAKEAGYKTFKIEARRSDKSFAL
ncbi:MAG TPA: THUMP domain-containing protein, partial [Treponemataceae bacterium]|nr:THUMP domain-containing protein [Treponemataceae bacterium]